MSNNRYFEKLLAIHCAPTLAGIKPASLLCCNRKYLHNKQEILAYYQLAFSNKGLSFFILSESPNYFALLVYRKKELTKILSSLTSRQLLMQFGYRENDDTQDVLNHLKTRMTLNKTFPHEIGLFLGYPLTDVIGFIENKGQNFKLSGYWKVYGDVEQARCIFNQYTQCSNEYCRCFDCGKAITDIVKAS